MVGNKGNNIHEIYDRSGYVVKILTADDLGNSAIETAASPYSHNQLASVVIHLHGGGGCTLVGQAAQNYGAAEQHYSLKATNVFLDRFRAKDYPVPENFIPSFCSARPLVQNPVQAQR